MIVCKVYRRHSRVFLARVRPRILLLHYFVPCIFYSVNILEYSTANFHLQNWGQRAQTFLSLDLVFVLIIEVTEYFKISLPSRSFNVRGKQVVNAERKGILRFQHSWAFRIEDYLLTVNIRLSP